MPDLKLYSYYRSSAAYRVRIALNLKQIEYQTLPIHLIKEGGQNWKQDYLDINPQGLIPALDDQGTIIFQSLAILEYLEEKFPLPSILPNQPGQRAFVRGLAQIICCEIHPLDNLRVLDYLKTELASSQSQIDQWYCHWLHEGLNAFEQQLAKRNHHSVFCCGDAPGMADLCLIPQLYNAHRFNCDISHLPIIQDIEQACAELQAFQSAAPEAQIDAQ